ncbi:MAG: hypothetical protein FWF97_00885 [Alphaproteobacteria bacterium]|nr:hypothetical protein [Alphaproteobacteria bacterium]
MKRLALCSLFFALCAGMALAADVAPSRAIPGQQVGVTAASSAQNQTETQGAVVSRVTANQPAAVGVQAATPSPRGAVVSRQVANAAPAASGRASPITEAARQVGRAARTDAASLNASAPMRRAGVTLRPTTAEVGGRAKIVGTDLQTGSNISAENRNLTARAATSAPAAPALNWEETSAATDSCMVQYTDCMDQFCAVIDANQKRCACSGRLSSYARVESAVKEANSQLNDVAQRIRYVGLTAPEIRAIMSATEAELELQNARDTTQSRRMLSDIEKLIRTPESFVAEGNNNFGLDLDLDFDLDTDFTEMFSLNNNTSFANLRGTDLFKMAQKRCAPVINACKAKGANTGQVTGRYDVEIDKDCIAYEKGLEKMNDTLKSNVRSATQMLQKARLAVLQDHNAYDAKGCVGALEQCMKDDMVCGADMAKCLDPTKRFIDENGEVILGQNISMIRKMMVNYDNSLIDANFINSAWSMSGYSACDAQNNNGKCIVRYLLSKIGMGDNANSGLCRPVLDKCRAFTYDDRGKYNNKNNILVNYIQRAMVSIRAAQERIISDYASSCMAEISACYSQQVMQINSWSNNANINNVYAVLKGACRNVALTCGYAVFSDDQVACPIDEPNTCIESISDIFYQSMLCPDYSSWVSLQVGAPIPRPGQIYQTDPNTGLQRFYVNERCVCEAGYLVISGRCELPYGVCEPGEVWNINLNRCQPDCGVGQIWNGMNCVTGKPPCPIPGPATDECSCSNASHGHCCPSGQAWDDGCKPKCSTANFPMDGSCACPGDVSTSGINQYCCPTGQESNGNSCVYPPCEIGQLIENCTCSANSDNNHCCSIETTWLGSICGVPQGSSQNSACVERNSQCPAKGFGCDSGLFTIGAAINPACGFIGYGFTYADGDGEHHSTYSSEDYVWVFMDESCTGYLEGPQGCVAAGLRCSYITRAGKLNGVPKCFQLEMETPGGSCP